jgi:hypothetical protein
MSASYYSPGEVELVGGAESLAVYMFGDCHVSHCFCKTCGISPFNVIASVPADYDGPARAGDYRINLGCVDGLDLAALEVTVIDGKSF